VQRRAVVSDGDEVIGPARNARRLEPGPEVGGHRVGLDRAAGLAGQEEERAREIDRRVDRGHRTRVRRVEHLERRPPDPDAEHRTDDFGRETRAAHPEQHDVRESAGANAIGELLHARQRRNDPVR
jgi:hypothetical protein